MPGFTPRRRRSMTTQPPPSTPPALRTVGVVDWARMFTPIQAAGTGQYTVTSYGTTYHDELLGLSTMPVVTCREATSTTLASTPVSSPVTTVAPAEAIVVVPPPPVVETLATRYPDGRNVYYKLHNCIVKYKGVWCLIKVSSHTYAYDRIAFEPLSNFGTRQQGSTPTPGVPLSEVLMSDLELSIPELGYANIGENRVSSYTYTGRRDYDAMNYAYINSGPNGVRSEEYRDPGFAAMLNNVYPTIQEAWDKIAGATLDKDLAHCFHKNWAFNRSTLNVVTLHHKGEQVGEVVLTPGATYSDVKLYPSADYLKRTARNQVGVSFEVYNL